MSVTTTITIETCGIEHEYELQFEACYEYSPATWEEPEYEYSDIENIRVDGVSGLDHLVPLDDDELMQLFMDDCEEEDHEPDYDHDHDYEEMF
jgi:hypothetical protein